MSDPLTKLTKLVETQKKVIQAAREASEKIAAKRERVIQAEKAQSDQTVKPSPNKSS